MSNFCFKRYCYGKQKESDLLERIQSNLGEQLLQEANQYSKKDYQTKTYNIELKSRRFYNSDKYSDWLVPCCKFKDTSKPLIIYYYWDGDKTLWRYNYNPEDVKDFIFRKSPISSQEHYDIPKRFFQNV